MTDASDALLATEFGYTIPELAELSPRDRYVLEMGACIQSGDDDD